MEPHEYHFNIYNSIIFGGIVQGLIFGFVVASSKKYRDTSTLILAAMIVIFSLHNFQYYLTSTWLIKNRVFYGILWTPGQLILAPMMLFYGLKLLHQEKAIPKKIIFWALLPFAIGLLAVNYMKVRYNYLEHKTAYFFLEAVIEFAGILLTITILSWLIFETCKTEREAKDFGISQVLPKLKWFRNILITFFFLCIIWFFVTLWMVLYDTNQDVWYFMWISLSVMIYWMGHVGIYKYGVNEERKKIRNFTLNRSSVMIIDKEKSSYLSTFEELLVTKKYYLNPELTLDKIADELGLSKSHLSRLINKELQTSFPEYINNLRVQEAKFYLKHPDFSNYTLISIGLEAGFSSKSAFNKTFKKFTGFTPSEYQKQENKS